MMKRHRTLRIVLAGVLITVVLLVGGVAVGMLLMWQNFSLGGGCRADTLTENIAQAEGIGRFRFPPSATNQEIICGGLNGVYVDAWFEMLPSDLDTFIGTTLIDPADLTLIQPEPGTRVPSFDGPGGERDVHVEQYLHGVYEATEIRQDVWIDVTNPERYRVYIVFLAG